MTMKRLYRFIHKHFTGFIRFWMLALIPCALSRHFAMWMMTANVAIWMLLLCGQYNGWSKEE